MRQIDKAWNVGASEGNNGIENGDGVIAPGKDEDTCTYYVNAGGETIRD